MSFAIRKDYRTITNLTRLIHKFSNLTQFFLVSVLPAVVVVVVVSFLINRGLNG